MMHMRTPSQTLQVICSSVNVAVAVIKFAGWGLPQNRWVRQSVICLAVAASFSMLGLVFSDSTDGNAKYRKAYVCLLDLNQVLSTIHEVGLLQLKEVRRWCGWCGWCVIGIQALIVAVGLSLSVSEGVGFPLTWKISFFLTSVSYTLLCVIYTCLFCHLHRGLSWRDRWPVWAHAILCSSISILTVVFFACVNESNAVSLAWISFTISNTCGLRIFFRRFLGFGDAEKQPLAADARCKSLKKISYKTMYRAFDLGSYGNIYDPEPGEEDVERHGYELAKACKIDKLSKKGVDRLLKDDEVGEGPFLYVENSYLVTLFTVYLEDIDTNM